jgi:hypothetical protein
MFQTTNQSPTRPNMFWCGSHDFGGLGWRPHGIADGPHLTDLTCFFAVFGADSHIGLARTFHEKTRI